MSPFDDSFFGGGFDELFRRLAGGDGDIVEYTVDSDGKKKTYRKPRKRTGGKLFLERIETSKKKYIIFDIPNKKNISANIADELIEDKYGEELATGKKMIEIKEGNNLIQEYPLEEKKIRDFEYSFKNGILEVSFRK